MKRSRKTATSSSSQADGLDTGLLLDEFDDPAIVLSHDQRIRFVNKACLQILGYSAEDLMDAPFSLLLKPGESERTLSELEECLAHNNTKYELACEILYKNKQAGRFLLKAVSGKLADRELSVLLRLKDVTGAIYGRDGALDFALCTTSRRATEEALLKSERKYTALFRESTTPAMLGNLTERKIVEVNDAWVQLFGYERAEAIGRSGPDLGGIPADEVREQVLSAVAEHKIVRNIEMAMYTKTREKLTVVFNASTLEYDGGHYVLFTYLDITERKKAEEKLFEASEKFQKIFDYSAIGMVVTALDGKLINVNRKMCEMFGCSKEELEGKHFNEMTYSDDIAVTNDMVHRMLSGDAGSVSFEKRYVRKNGEVFWTITISSVLRDLSGKPLHFITQLRDITYRKQYEERIFEISERYRKSFDYSAIGMSLTGLDGTIVNANKKLCDVFGYKREELEGRTYFELMHPEDIERTREAVHGMVSGDGDSITYEKRFSRKDGDVFWASVTSASLRDMENRPVQFITQLIDITERKRLEEELKARENFSRAVMDNLPIGISVNSFAPPLNFDYMNDNFPKFYRTTREALKGTDVFFDAVYEEPEFRRSIRKRILADMQSGDPKRMRWENVPITRKGAETRYVSAYNTVVTGRDMHISIVTDETERVAALEALRKNAARLLKMHEFDQAIIKGFESAGEIGETALGCIIGLLGPKSASIGIINAAGGEIGLVTAEKTQTAFSHDRRPLTQEEFKLFGQLMPETVYELGELRDSGLKQLLRRLFKISGSSRALLMPLYSSAGSVGLLCIGRTGTGTFTQTDRDVVQEIGLQAAMAIEQQRLKDQNYRYATELEKMIGERTAQLEEAVKELEAFTYSVSHDLRAPLRTLNGFVRILLEDYGGLLDDEGRRVCTVIGNGAQQMGKLIDDLLTMSRVGRSSMVLMPIDMEALVRNLFAELTTESQRARIRFTVGPLPKAVADPTLLRQVWINLLENAVKFSSKKPEARIEVSGSAEGDDVVYTVADNGAGFDMKYQDKLFGVFQRLHSVKEFDGTGVGLAIVQRIIRRHGGRVWAQSAENNGATFYFSLKKETDTHVK